MKKIFFFLFLGITPYIFTQLTVDNTKTAQQLVQNILAGPGVTVSNVTYNGSPLAIGSFDGINANVGFKSGIILATGNISNAIGPNNITNSFTNFGQPGDIDINNLVFPNFSFDATVLEFDFIPVSDTVIFNYVFASEEYLDQLPTGVNDAFGFFISGPGIIGPFSNNSKNIALIPGTSSFVSIQNINDVLNSQFYIDNETPPGQSVQYDGFTTPFQAVSAVQCGQTYHLKIVIADALDGFWDSGVFLEAGSLSSVKIDFKLEAALTGDTVFYEGCTGTEFTFIRPSDQVSEALNIFLDVEGTATPGMDYTPIPDILVFEIGENSISVPFETFADKLTEGSESLIVTAKIVTECGDTIEIVRMVTIHDAISIDSLISTPSLNCSNTGSAESFISNQVGSVNYSWNGPSNNGPIVGNSVSIQDLVSGWYYLNVNDDYCQAKDSIFVFEPASLTMDSLIATPSLSCTNTGSAESFISNQVGSVNYSWNGPGNNGPIVGNSASIQDLVSGWYYLNVNDDYCQAKDSIFVPEPAPLTIDSLKAPVNCTNTGSVESFVSNQVGSVNYSWSGPGNNGPIVGNTSSIQDLDGGWYYLTATDDYCQVKDSIFVDELNPPIAIISPGNTVGSPPLTISFSNLSQNADTYFWDFGNGEEMAVTNLSNQSSTYSTENSYKVTLIAFQQACSDTTTITIELISESSILEPNIFTPNSDGANETFSLQPKSFVSFNYTIFNRWGNIMFEGDLKNSDWNGLTQDNKPAEAGTYFYIFSGLDLTDKLKEGRGFFQLVR